MYRQVSLVLVVAMFLLGAPPRSSLGADNGPTYSSVASKEIITKMVAAHGGIEKWRACPTVCFNSHLQVDFGGGNWVDFWEEVTVDPATRRVYAVLPNADGTKGMIAFDGQQAWSAGNLQGISNAPARFTAWRNFYLFNIPWLTQDDGVIFGEAGKATIPNDSKEYLAVPMSFEGATGDTSKDTYVLYIDPDTYQLKASEYGMTFKSMVPEGLEETPRSVFVWEETATVDGLVVLTRYNVYWKQDGSKAVGGEVSKWSFQRQFDDSRMEMPSDGAIDESQP